MGSHKKSLGKEGEDAAVRYLKKKGHRILCQNKRVSGVEFDIISEFGKTLCFIEVKTRSTANYGFPEEFIDKKKQKRLIRGAQLFSSSDLFSQHDIRFDAISVIALDSGFSISHFEDAFDSE